MEAEGLRYEQELEAWEISLLLQLFPFPCSPFASFWAGASKIDII